MMWSSRRLAYGAVIIAATASLMAGCASSEDDVASPQPNASAPTTAAKAKTDGFVLPKPNPAAKLDPTTKQKCGTVWSFQLFNYASHVMKDRTNADEVKRLTDGVQKFRDKVTTEVPELAASVKPLTDDALKTLQAPADQKPAPSGAIEQPSRTVLQYLRQTCKMT